MVYVHFLLMESVASCVLLEHCKATNHKTMIHGHQPYHHTGAGQGETAEMAEMQKQRKWRKQLIWREKLLQIWPPRWLLKEAFIVKLAGSEPARGD